MNIEISSVVKFEAGPMTLIRGDLVTCTHVYYVNKNDPETRKEILSTQEITENTVWDRSILFFLDGALNHIVGNEDTQEWLEGLV